MTPKADVAEKLEGQTLSDCVTAMAGASAFIILELTDDIHKLSKQYSGNTKMTLLETRVNELREGVRGC